MIQDSFIPKPTKFHTRDKVASVSVSRRNIDYKISPDSIVIVAPRETKVSSDRLPSDIELSITSKFKKRESSEIESLCSVLYNRLHSMSSRERITPANILAFSMELMVTIEGLSNRMKSITGSQKKQIVLLSVKRYVMDYNPADTVLLTFVDEFLPSIIDLMIAVDTAALFDNVSTKCKCIIC
jgi:hypothetical protein